MTVKIVMNLYAHNFGLLIPCESGVVWRQQTDGVSCHQVEIEGIFIPLDKPIKHTFTGQKGTASFKYKSTKLLEKLTTANYEGRGTRKIWDDIFETMYEFGGIKLEDVDWEDVMNDMISRGYPGPCEGYKYVRITKLGELYNGKKSWADDLSSLIGKPLILIYPNCD
jgi:hypothetical protein